jgi:hypothetical protein
MDPFVFGFHLGPVVGSRHPPPKKMPPTPGPPEPSTCPCPGFASKQPATTVRYAGNESGNSTSRTGKAAEGTVVPVPD